MNFAVIANENASVSRFEGIGSLTGAPSSVFSQPRLNLFKLLADPDAGAPVGQFGGDGGSRTHVRKPSVAGIYRRSRWSS